MLVETKTLGKIEISEDKLFKIPSGLFGFEDYTEFALIDSEYEPFFWFQSLQEKSLAFLLIDPFIIADDYEAEIDDSELSKIGVEDPSDVVVLTIVTVPVEGGVVTANFQGPIVINKKNHLCMQAILDGSKWTTKHNILEALKLKENK